MEKLKNQFENEINETIENRKVVDGWGLKNEYTFKGAIFMVFVDPESGIYNPLYYVFPSNNSTIDILPPIKGFRRNHEREYYTIRKALYHDEIMKLFLNEYVKIVETEKDTLYHH